MIHTRTFRVLLLCWSAVWFGAVLPGHQRGIIRLAGSTEACSADPRLPPCHQRKLPKPKPDAPGAPARGNCAVCLYLSTLATPPPVELGLTYLGPCQLLPTPQPHSAESQRVILPYNERGPPLA